jgi:hypothetical protein
MCEICTSEGKDYLFVNGPKDQVVTQQLYKVYQDSVAPVRLCYIHSIELFMLGEIRFLKEHLTFARALATRSRKHAKSNESSFGF